MLKRINFSFRLFLAATEESTAAPTGEATALPPGKTQTTSGAGQ